MGYRYEFNWALKLKPEQGFPKNPQEKEIYKFKKSESRLYPLGCNLQLINQNWEVIGELQILEITVNEKETKGRFKITKLYSEEEKKISTKLAKENSEILKEKGYATT
ncbi:MAG: DUF2584 family protein [Nanoarchaeota archaeon]|nr:DUF2584 family protein [Nanoarchaeota archaeon]